MIKVLITKLGLTLPSRRTGVFRHFPAPTLTIIFTLICFMAWPYPVAHAEESIEDGIKAAYLYKFSAYVDWPAEAFTSVASPFNLCVFGSSAQFNQTLKKLVLTESVNGRKIVVNEIGTLDKESACHMLYISKLDAQRTASLIENVRGTHMLTVSDHAEQGVIGFVVVNNRLRFNIDDAAAAENGLVISSRLLRLAVNVKRRE